MAEVVAPKQTNRLRQCRALRHTHSWVLSVDIFELVAFFLISPARKMLYQVTLTYSLEFVKEIYHELGRSEEIFMQIRA